MKKVDMKKIAATVLLLLPNLWLNAQQRIEYPVAPKGSVVDTIWGQAVSDPYRAMEAIHSPAVEQWVAAQEKLTKKAGRRIASKAQTIDMLSQVNYKPLIRQRGYNFFYSYAQSGETPSLYLQPGENRQQVLLFNPKSIAKEKSVSISDFALSPNKQTLALTLSSNGSDWREVRFLRMNTKELLTDELRFVKYSTIAWHGDGVLYASYTVDSTAQALSGNIGGRALYYHRLGTDQSRDILLFKPSEANDFFSYEVTPDAKWLVVYHTIRSDRGVQNLVSSVSLSDSLVGELKPFLSIPDNRYEIEVVGSLNDSLIVFTNLLAPNGQVILFSRDRLNEGRKLIPEQGSLLTQVKLLNGKLVCQYNNHHREQVAIHNLSGEKVSQWSIPEGFSITDLTGSTDDSMAVYSFHSYYTPPTVYSINLNTFVRKPVGKTIIGYNHKQFSTILLSYKSKDSTEIPIFITYRKGVILNGNNPVLLYGYGGFGISTKPFYDPMLMAFLLDGGVLAMPAIRGGGDFPGWHDAGRRLNKQNSIDDFIAAAEFLTKSGFTNPNRLAIMGGSNGGLIVGAALTQRPELFRTAVSESGVFDMLRYQNYNIGYSYLPEYGSVNDSSDFINLRSYSPVHNVKAGIHYPSTLLVASDNDDRVSPFHSFKFLAELQAKGDGKNPYLLYYQHNAGHAGSDVYKSELEKRGFVVGWLERELGMR